MMYDILKNEKHQAKTKILEKEEILWEKECLSLQSERQGIGRVPR